MLYDCVEFELFSKFSYFHSHSLFSCYVHFYNEKSLRIFFFFACILLIPNSFCAVCWPILILRLSISFSLINSQFFSSIIFFALTLIYFFIEAISQLYYFEQHSRFQNCYSIGIYFNSISLIKFFLSVSYISISYFMSKHTSSYCLDTYSYQLLNSPFIFFSQLFYFSNALFYYSILFFSSQIEVIYHSQFPSIYNYSWLYFSTQISLSFKFLSRVSNAPFYYSFIFFYFLSLDFSPDALDSNQDIFSCNAFIAQIYEEFFFLVSVYSHDGIQLVYSLLFLVFLFAVIFSVFFFQELTCLAAN